MTTCYVCLEPEACLLGAPYRPTTEDGSFICKHFVCAQCITSKQVMKLLLCGKCRAPLHGRWKADPSISREFANEHANDQQVMRCRNMFCQFEGTKSDLVLHSVVCRHRTVEATHINDSGMRLRTFVPNWAKLIVESGERADALFVPDCVIQNEPPGDLDPLFHFCRSASVNKLVSGTIRGACASVKCKVKMVMFWYWHDTSWVLMHRSKVADPIPCPLVFSHLEFAVDETGSKLVNSFGKDNVHFLKLKHNDYSIGFTRVEGIVDVFSLRNPGYVSFKVFYRRADERAAHGTNVIIPWSTLRKLRISVYDSASDLLAMPRGPGRFSVQVKITWDIDEAKGKRNLTVFAFPWSVCIEEEPFFEPRLCLEYKQGSEVKTHLMSSGPLVLTDVPPPPATQPRFWATLVENLDDAPNLKRKRMV